MGVATNQAHSLWRWLFWACAALMLLTMLRCSQGYGMSWDEAAQQEYGESVLSFYGSWGRDHSYINERTHAHWYGGLAEAVCALAARISGGDVYDARHRVVASFGLVAMVLTGLIARRLAGWRAGFLALLFAFLTPVFFGHSMYNSKDIPFATGYAGGVCLLLRFFEEMPVPRLRTGALTALWIAVALNIRVGGLLLVGYLLAGWPIAAAFRWRTSQGPGRLGAVLRGIPVVATTALLAYLLGTLLWPYALTDPFSRPLQVLRAMSSFPFDSYSLFAGRWIHAWEIPWAYLPTWIGITTPPFLSVGVMLVPALFVLPRVRAGLRTHPAQAAFVLLAAVLPVAYIIANGSNVYDGWRHVLFVYPPLAALCAVAWDCTLVALPGPVLRAAGAAALAVALAQPAVWMIANHPFESFYFSPFVGGGAGAFGRYEVDYYGTSLRQAVEWIAAHAASADPASAPVRVLCLYGERESCEHFVGKYPRLRYVRVPEASDAWDYSIVLPVQAKYDPSLLRNWPPAGTVHAETVDGAPLFAILENSYRRHVEGRDATGDAGNQGGRLLKQSLTLLRRGDYVSSVVASDRVLEWNRKEAIAWNNKCAALNRLKLYAEAAEACRAAIDRGLHVRRLRANYRKALAGKPADPARAARSCLELSLKYYSVGLYDLAAKIALRALHYDPVSTIAYNNACAAYNALGQYDAAETACRKGLAIDPDFESLRDNLKVAVARGS